MQRARQRELEFFEKAIRETDEGGTKRKNEEHDLDHWEAKRRNEEVPIMRHVDDEGRGQKRPAEGSADESPDTNETEGDVQMDLVDISFAAYEEYGGLRMVACTKPDEDMRESDEQFQEEDEGDEDWRAGGGFKDERTGKALDPAKVRAAREEELKELDRRVWVDAGVLGQERTSSRWCKMGGCRQGLWCEPKQTCGERLPSSEPCQLQGGTLRCNATFAVGEDGHHVGGQKQQRRSQKKGDVRGHQQTHLYAPVQEEECVDLPPEKAQAGKCARLLYTLYGMRTAASNWEREHSGTLQDAGFAVGRGTSCAFYHPGRDVRIIVHGDDLVEGEEEDLEWARSVLEAKYIVKVRGIMGPEEKDKKFIEILGSAVEWVVVESGPEARRTNPRRHGDAWSEVAGSRRR